MAGIVHTKVALQNNKVSGGVYTLPMTDIAHWESEHSPNDWYC
jgi:hypothetical protein